MQTLEHGVWVSVTELAAIVGLSKARVSQKVDKLEAAGLVTTRSEGKGRPKYVNRIEYQNAVDKLQDGVKRLGYEHRADNTAQSQPIVNKATQLGEVTDLAISQAKKAECDAEMARIKLDEVKGSVLPLYAVTDAMTRAAEVLVRGLDSLPAKLDDIVALQKKEGSLAAKVYFKGLIRDLREDLAKELTNLSSKPQEEDTQDDA
jgi:DNA-binding transcriptional ArsR family regulator